MLLANIFHDLTLIQADFLQESQVSRLQTLCHLLQHRNYTSASDTVAALVKPYLSVNAEVIKREEQSETNCPFPLIVWLSFPPLTPSLGGPVMSVYSVAQLWFL